MTANPDEVARIAAGLSESERQLINAPRGVAVLTGPTIGRWAKMDLVKYSFHNGEIGADFTETGLAVRQAIKDKSDG